MDLILITAFGLGNTLPTLFKVIHTYVIGVAGPVTAFAGTIFVFASLDGLAAGPTGVYVGISAAAFAYTLYLLRTKHIS